MQYLCLRPCLLAAVELHFLCETRFHREFKLCDKEQQILLINDESCVLTVANTTKP